MLGWEYPPRITGGLGVACAGLVRGLRENGVDVLLLLPPAGRAGPRRARRRGGIGALEIVHVPVRRPFPRVDPYATSGAPPARTSRAGALYAGDVADAVRRYASAAYALARRRRFDVVHAHDWLTFPAGIAAKQASGRPLVAHVHATERDRSGTAGDSSPAAAIERRAFPVADRVVAVSRYTAAVLRQQYGVTGDRIRVVHNAVDPPEAAGARRRRRRGPPLVLFAGRVTGQKGPEQFVRAAALVASERPDARFVLAGAGDRLDAVRAEAAALGLSRRMEFPGFLPRRALDRLLARADVFVMPSRSEPFGLVALEALARGTPAIVSRSSGVSEVVPRALRADFGDAEELAGKVLALLALPRLRESQIASGAEALRNLTWREAGARCAAIYDELVSASAPGGTIAPEP
jgi:glycosyltransferase involved in cell wall biosynthesis